MQQKGSPVATTAPSDFLMLEGRPVLRRRLRGRAVLFRRPRWSDLPAFYAMRRAFHDEMIMANNEAVDPPKAAQRLAEILVRLETGKARWLFAFLDGQLVGQGQADVSGTLYATVGLAFVKEARGLGLGRLMMGQLDREAVALGRRRLFLTVWSANAVAFELYKKLGFREVGRRADWQTMPRARHRYSDLVEMVKRLD